MQAQVKARKVGDSVVITLTRPVLDGAGIAEGDSLRMRTLAQGRVLIAKEGQSSPAHRRLELELDVLQRTKEALEAELRLAEHEHASGIVSAHPGVEDDVVMESCARRLEWDIRKADLAIAEKRLELFDLTGEDGL